MKRIRHLYMLLGALLSLPLLIVAFRAIQGAELEVRAHHQAVANRLFDALESKLTIFLREQERRTYSEVRNMARPEDSFVLGYFEIDPDGRVHSPAHGAQRALVEQAVKVYDSGLKFEGAERLALAPGTTTSNLGRAPRGKLSLNALNRGSTSRVGRSGRQEWVAPTRANTPTAAAPIGLFLSPLRGTLVTQDRMLLVRRVDTTGKKVAQGLVIDVPGLARWLIADTLDGSAVAPYARLEVAPRPALPSRTPHGFTHRFAEPFDDVGASLALQALPDAADTTSTYVLALGLLLIAPLGLIALYRMTASAVRFAERRNDFVSAVTHELKTPLTSIRMYGEMLREGMVLDDEKQQTYYGHITAEAERLSRLVDNVLELSRLEKDTRSMSLNTGDPGSALREVAEVFGPQARKAGFELHVDAPPDLPSCSFDRDALVQVVFNLVDNAVKYARDAEDRRIVLGAQVEDGQVVLSVRDHGPGVPPQQLRHIFEPFYRGERELTRTATGTGIGLALVTGLMDRMGGGVQALNAPEGGFEVRLRLARP